MNWRAIALPSEAKAPRARLVVTVVDPKSDVDEQPLRRAITAAVAAHLKARSASVRTADLTIEVTKCVCKDHRCQLVVELGGTINSNPLSRRCKATRNPNATSRAGASGVLGALAVRAVSMAITAIANQAFTGRASSEPFRQCFEEVMAEVAITLDKGMGLAESSTAQLWSKFSLARWIAAGGVFALLLCWIVVERGTKAFLFGVIVGAWPAGAVFFLVHLVGLMMMPDSFFTEDPRGRKALARAGVKSLGSLRMLCIVLGMVLLGVLAIGLALAIGMTLESKQR